MVQELDHPLLSYSSRQPPMMIDLDHTPPLQVGQTLIFWLLVQAWPEITGLEYVPEMALEGWSGLPSCPSLTAAGQQGHFIGITFFYHLLLCLFLCLHFFFFPFETHLCCNANTCFYSKIKFFWFLEYSSWPCLGIMFIKLFLFQLWISSMLGLFFGEGGNF